MISLENTLQLFRVNLKIACRSNILIAVLLLALTPIIFSISNLDFTSAVRICEQFVALIGVIILVPVFSPEEESGIRETVEAKYTSQLYIYIIRIIMAVTAIAALISLGIFILLMYGGSFKAGILLAGTFATALFLGTLGLFAAASRQIAAGYMVPIVYFILDMMTKGKYTKNFYLFSLMNNSFREKYHLLGAAVILIVMALLTYVTVRKRR
jgi:hypothetical protein